jgi:hypothetical protein
MIRVNTAVFCEGAVRTTTDFALRLTLRTEENHIKRLWVVCFRITKHVPILACHILWEITWFIYLFVNYEGAKHVLWLSFTHYALSFPWPFKVKWYIYICHLLNNKNPALWPKIIVTCFTMNLILNVVFVFLRVNKRFVFAVVTDFVFCEIRAAGYICNTEEYQSPNVCEV